MYSVNRQEANMTEAQVERILHKPNPFLTLIPFWIVSGAVTLAIGAVTVLIMLGAAPKYHMNLIGESDLLISEAPLQIHGTHASAQHRQEESGGHPGS